MEWSQPLFAQRVTSVLEKRGWKQNFFAKEIFHKPQSTFNGWLNSESAKPSPRDFASLAAALNVTAGWLAFGDAPMNQAELALLELWRRLSPKDQSRYLQHMEIDAIPAPAMLVIDAKKHRDIGLDITALRAHDAPAPYGPAAQ